MRQVCSRLFVLLYLALTAQGAQAAQVTRIDQGIIVTPDAGPAKRVRVVVYGPGRFRITAVPSEKMEKRPSLMVTARPAGAFTLKETKDAAVIVTTGGSVSVAKATGRVTLSDAAGKLLLAQSSDPAFGDGKAGVQFNRGTDEGFYGLGQHQNRQMNYNGEDVELAQHNMDIAIPFLVSTRGYGMLWDNESITRFGNPKPYGLAGETITVSHGGQPGWRADYYLGDRLAVSRAEPVINYQYIRDQKNWPAGAKAQTVASSDTGQNTAGVVVGKQRVVWTGDVTPARSGVHKFRLYVSSYVKLWMDGKLVIDAWRQNWNPWFRNFDVPMVAGKTAKIRIEWEPNAGYIALLHNEPLPDADRHSLWFTSDVAEAADYYLVTGADMDGVIAGYRALTGKAELMPRWAYGFWQSRQRYETQEQLLDVVRAYRERGIPFDNIVQDWFYWPEDQWGCHCFDAKRFPDPVGMVDAVHKQNARLMISVWPKFYPNTANAKELAAKGFLYEGNLRAKEKDWVGPGYENTDYDPYAPEARQIYFRQMKEGLVDKGFDAWWMDATEPDIHSNLSIEERIDRMGPTAFGSAASLFNSFPLIHADGVADGLRAAQPDKRPFILTRSGFGGIQRASAALWSGDVAARWDDLRDQISAGVNLSMSGIPNWTHDIGGFAVEDRYSRQQPEHLAEWRELNLRWFQFGAFSPLFRSHGEFPRREIHEISAGDPAMYEAMLAYDQLRYRLMPYIYTIAADTYWHDGTMMRGLVMDFPADRNVWGIDDQYMFGPAFLVAPVTEFGARSRDVYLPAGSGWYDWQSGAWFKGGQTIKADAPRERMPLFVRAGSIVPTGAEIQSTTKMWKLMVTTPVPFGPVGNPTGTIDIERLNAYRQESRLVLHVFTGNDGHFELYEDDDLTPAYKTGDYARIPIRWDEKAQLLTIGQQEGRDWGMKERPISVRFHRPGQAAPVEARDIKVDYWGREIRVRRGKVEVDITD